jgi:hypothetical protein
MAMMAASLFRPESVVPATPGPQSSGAPEQKEADGVGVGLDDVVI